MSSVPSDVSVVAVLAFIVWWFTKWADRAEKARTKQVDSSAKAVASLETKLETCQQEIYEQRQLKHAALNRLAAIQGRAELVASQARKCTCGAMTPLLPLFDREAKEFDEPL